VNLPLAKARAVLRVADRLILFQKNRLNARRLIFVISVAPLRAGKVQKVAQVHDSVWPEKEQQGTGIMGGLKVYSQQTVIAVETRKSDSQQS
jgi:hypothetical protein